MGKNGTIPLADGLRDAEEVVLVAGGDGLRGGGRVYSAIPEDVNFEIFQIARERKLKGGEISFHLCAYEFLIVEDWLPFEFVITPLEVKAELIRKSWMKKNRHFALTSSSAALDILQKGPAGKF